MNRLLVILNVVLLALVGVLFYLHFSNKKTAAATGSPAVRPTGGTAVAPGTFSIAYFDIDSITNNYQYCKDVKAGLEKRKESAEQSIITMQKNYESRLAQLQQKAMNMNEQEMEKARNELGGLQQKVLAAREKAFADLEDERKRKELDIKKNIETFLDGYNTPRKFTFIMADEPGIFYFRDSALNITNDVLSGLNADYKNKKPQ
jgi:outer membrane protein